MAKRKDCYQVWTRPNNTSYWSPISKVMTAEKCIVFVTKWVGNTTTREYQVVDNTTGKVTLSVVPEGKG